MKTRVLTATGLPLSDLKSPFQPKPGEGSDITLDQIYTNLIIHEGRSKLTNSLNGDRELWLERYSKANVILRPKRPADIFDANKRNILVVGHPGTGKTMFCTKILRDWACDNGTL